MAVLSTRETEPLPPEDEVSELKLKSGTGGMPPRLTMVKTTKDMQFFGVNGSQLSETMPGLKLRWDINGGFVRVFHDNWPNEERWIFPANISHLAWSHDT